jgi:sugar lactone lactonase YvrE
MDIEVVSNSETIIGESPTWVAGQRSLYWIDVKKPALFRISVETGTQREWALSSDIGAFAFLADESGAVVALREGIFRLDFDTGSLSLLAPPPFDTSVFRFNEGACDASGRFWIGAMFDPPGNAGTSQRAPLHSFSIAGGTRAERDWSDLHNGMAWSADGRRFYLSHTHSGEIFAHPFDVKDGTIGAPELFARVPQEAGMPDGAAVDTEGGYWCALHGGGRLRRYTQEGEIDRDVVLPVSQPTMCTFGGDALDFLYVTSATHQLPPEQRRKEPLAGSLLRFRPGKTGVPKPCHVM